MRWIRGTVNAILVATLIRPVARRAIARARRRAREHPVAPLLVPAEELFETVLLAELGAARAEPTDGRPASTDGRPEPAEDKVVERTSEAKAITAPEVLEEIAGRSTARTLLLLALVTVAVASAAVAIATIIRRRRDARARARARARQGGQGDRVAVPVERSSVEPAEAAV